MSTGVLEFKFGFPTNNDGFLDTLDKEGLFVGNYKNMGGKLLKLT
jgi:hypothetical protein